MFTIKYKQQFRRDPARLRELASANLRLQKTGNAFSKTPSRFFGRPVAPSSLNEPIGTKYLLIY
jgi:hypothetical protein